MEMFYRFLAAALLLSPAALGIPLTNVSSPTHYAVAGGADPGRSAFDVAGAGVSVPGYSPVYPLPLIEPEPALVAGLPSFTVSLDGNWQRTPTPSARFWEEKASDRSWTDVAVPFTRFRGGSFQRALEPYAYRRECGSMGDSSASTSVHAWSGPATSPMQ
jgi:hypothetical protein